MSLKKEPLILDGDHENPKNTNNVSQQDVGNETFAIRVPTLNNWICAVKYLYDHGYYWDDFETEFIVNSHFWKNYQEDTCLIICDHTLFYSSYEYCISENMVILGIHDMYTMV